MRPCHLSLPLSNWLLSRSYKGWIRIHLCLREKGDEGINCSGRRRNKICTLRWLGIYGNLPFSCHTGLVSASVAGMNCTYTTSKCGICERNLQEGPCFPAKIIQTIFFPTGRMKCLSQALLIFPIVKLFAFVKGHKFPRSYSAVFWRLPETSADRCWTVNSSPFGWRGWSLGGSFLVRFGLTFSFNFFHVSTMITWTCDSQQCMLIVATLSPVES